MKRHLTEHETDSGLDSFIPESSNNSGNTRDASGPCAVQGRGFWNNQSYKPRSFRAGTGDINMKKPTVDSVINEIKTKLTSIEGYMAWLIKSEQRFRIGQRVEWSRGAHSKGIVPKTTLAKKGVVKRLDGFLVSVLIDGRKHPRSFLHAFFNPVSGSKLF